MNRPPGDQRTKPDGTTPTCIVAAFLTHRISWSKPIGLGNFLLDQSAGKCTRPAILLARKRRISSLTFIRPCRRHHSTYTLAVMVENNLAKMRLLPDWAARRDRNQR